MSKNVDYVKTTLLFGSSMLKGCPFFPSFHEKMAVLIPIFYQKYVYYLKHTLLWSPHFVKECPFSKKHCSYVIFLSFLWETLCCQAHFWSKICQYCENCSIFWVYKVNSVLFSRISTKKSLISCLLYFVKKSSIL